jgi:hypothetical protein
MSRVPADLPVFHCLLLRRSGNEGGRRRLSYMTGSLRIGGPKKEPGQPGETAMQYTTDKIEQTRANVLQTEQRIVRQRRRVEKMLIERHPADEAQAQLLIMEQSLIAMTRFLKNLERALEVDELGSGQSKAKRMKAHQRSAEPATAATPAGPDQKIPTATAE